MFDKNNELDYNNTKITNYTKSGNVKNINCKIGDIFNVYLHGNSSESVVCGMRPAIVYQNNLGNKYSPNLIVIPLTSQIKRTDLVTHVVLDARRYHLHRTSMAICESPITIDKHNVGEYITTLPDEAMQKIATAALLATGGVAYINVSDLQKIIEQAIQLNTGVA